MHALTDVVGTINDRILYERIIQFAAACTEGVHQLGIIPMCS